MESGTVVGWQEPGIVELAPHELMMWLRTDLGYLYLTFSHDDGMSWSTPRPGLPFRSPTAPAPAADVQRGHGSRQSADGEAFR